MTVTFCQTQQGHQLKGWGRGVCVQLYFWNGEWVHKGDRGHPSHKTKVAMRGRGCSGWLWRGFKNEGTVSGEESDEETKERQIKNQRGQKRCSFLSYKFRYDLMFYKLHLVTYKLHILHIVSKNNKLNSLHIEMGIKGAGVVLWSKVIHPHTECSLPLSVWETTR